MSLSIFLGQNLGNSFCVDLWPLDVLFIGSVKDMSLKTKILSCGEGQHLLVKISMSLFFICLISLKQYNLLKHYFFLFQYYCVQILSVSRQIVLSTINSPFEIESTSLKSAFSTYNFFYYFSFFLKTSSKLFLQTKVLFLNAISTSEIHLQQSIWDNISCQVNVCLIIEIDTEFLIVD